MTDEAMSPLRRRMIEDMTIRKLAPKTQHDYVQRIKNFAAFLGRSPDTASFEDVRRYQLHLAASGVGVPTLNQTVSTLRFFFRVTLRRHEIVEHTHVIHETRKPVVLSPEEVARLLDAAPGLKYKAALSVAYGAGLRTTEVVSLKVSDVDSKRMIIRVERSRAAGRQPSAAMSCAARTAPIPPSPTTPAATATARSARAHPRRAGQRPQGPLRDAVAAPARPAADLVEGGAPAGLAIPRSQSGAADDHAPTQSRLPRRGPDGGDQQARLAAHLAAQLCHPPARAEHRCPRHPGAARNGDILPTNTWLKG